MLSMNYSLAVRKPIHSLARLPAMLHLAGKLTPIWSMGWELSRGSPKHRIDLKSWLAGGCHQDSDPHRTRNTWRRRHPLRLGSALNKAAGFGAGIALPKHTSSVARPPAWGQGGQHSWEQSWLEGHKSQPVGTTKAPRWMGWGAKGIARGRLNLWLL